MTSPGGDIARRFVDSGLAAPPIPSRFADSLTSVGEWAVSTRPLATSPYSISRWVEEFVDDDPDDFLVVAHTGHGANSWFLLHHVAMDGIGIFTESGWGGVTGDAADREHEVEVIRRRFELIERLLDALDDHPLDVDSGERLCVVASDTTGNQLAKWNRVSGTPSWTRCGDALDEAVQLLRDQA